MSVLSLSNFKSYNPQVKLAPQKNSQMPSYMNNSLKPLKNDVVSFKGIEKTDFDEKEYKENIAKVADALKNAKRVAILTHVSPDGDAISSSAATLNLMRKLPNIEKAAVFLNGETPCQFSFLEDTKSFVNIHNKAEAKEHSGKFDTVITLDCANKERLAHCESIFDSAETKLKVDHHPSREKYAQMEAVNAKAASATEVLIDLAKALGVKPENDSSLSKDLYTGILTDTGGFRYLGNPQKTFSSCSELSKSGIDTKEIYKQAIDFIPKSVMPLYKKIVNSLTFSEDGKIIFVKADNNDPDYKADVPSAKNLVKSLTSQFLSIEGVEAGATLTKSYSDNSDSKFTGISLRSNHIDISGIAKQNGGGGHKNASGCSMAKSVEETQTDLTNSISEKIKEYEAENK